MATHQRRFANGTGQTSCARLLLLFGSLSVACLRSLLEQPSLGLLRLTFSKSILQTSAISTELPGQCMERPELQLSLSKKRQSLCKTRLLLFLLSCGDINVNPGPVADSCFLCHRVFRGNSKPVTCASCLRRANSGCSHITVAE